MHNLGHMYNQEGDCYCRVEVNKMHHGEFHSTMVNRSSKDSVNFSMRMVCQMCIK